MAIFIRKAMILAAGRGLRLDPLTREKAKAVLPFLNTPIILPLFEMLRGIGIHEILVNLHHAPESIKECLSDEKGIIYSPEETVLGTAGAIKRCQDLLSEPFLLMNGDITVDIDLKEVIATHEELDALATLVLKPKPEGSPLPGINTDERSFVSSIGPPKGGPYLFTGIHVIDPRLFEFIPKNDPCDIVQDVYKSLLDRRMAIGSFIMDNFWADLGTPDRFLSASLARLAREDLTHARHGDSLLAPDCSVSGSARLERVVVGSGAKIGTGCRLRETVIFPRAIIEPGSRLQHAVVGESAVIGAGSRIEGKLVASVESQLMLRPLQAA